MRERSTSTYLENRKIEGDFPVLGEERTNVDGDKKAGLVIFPGKKRRTGEVAVVTSTVTPSGRDRVIFHGKVIRTVMVDLVG